MNTCAVRFFYECMHTPPPPVPCIWIAISIIYPGHGKSPVLPKFTYCISNNALRLKPPLSIFKADYILPIPYHVLHRETKLYKTIFITWDLSRGDCARKHSKFKLDVWVIARMDRGQSSDFNDAKQSCSNGSSEIKNNYTDAKKYIIKISFIRIWWRISLYNRIGSYDKSSSIIPTIFNF